MDSVVFVYNPSSGESVITSLLDDIVVIHQKRGLALIPYRLSFHPSQGEEILSLLDLRCRHILIAGGDGTVNYVVNLLKKANIELPVAVLPTGTANDFANLFDIPSDPLKACERILSGDIRHIDLGVVNGIYFVNVFSCGLFTDVSQRTPTIYKNTFGKLAYYVGGLGELPKFRRMQLSIISDGGNYEGSSMIFFVFNGRSAGKLNIAYLSSVDDGMLDVLVIKGDHPGQTLHTIFHYLSRSKGEYPPGVVHLRCTTLTADVASPETTDIDGQAGPQFPLSIECAKGALQIIVPKQRTKRKIRDNGNI